MPMQATMGIRPTIRSPRPASPPLRPTLNVCACGEQATFINGYYTVNSRRVRVWVCSAHNEGNPLRELPAPASVKAALDAEAEHLANMSKRYRYNVDSDKSESVKFLAPTGHGEPLAYDRVAAWRWGGF